MEQVSVLRDLTAILPNVDNNNNHNVILAGNSNIFFDASLDAKSGTATLKNRSINKLIELNETWDCTMWGIRNPKKYKYTFWQKHLSGIIQQR